MDNIDIQQVIESCPIKLYCNGFITAVGASDVTLILNLSGKNISALNMSYTTAKSLAETLTNAIQQFEDTIGQKIMTNKFIGDKLNIPKISPS
jgi:hypothetical protein